MDSQLSIEALPEGAPKSKRDYFALSTEQGLPKRCPILQRCERRTFTIRVSRYNDGEHYVLPDEPQSPVVKMVEEATLAGGRNNFYVNHMCPEVALFDPSNSFPFMSGFPMTSAEYDKYWSPQYRLLDTGHFSECSEYIGTINDSHGLQELPPMPPVAGIQPISGFNGANVGRDLIVHLGGHPTSLEKASIWGRWLSNGSAIATIMALVVGLAVWLYGDSILK